MGQACRMSPRVPAELLMENAVPRSPWARWALLFSSRFSDLLFAFLNWARGPCTPTRPSMPTSSDSLLAGETFTYDPQDRHGPALAALALPLARMQGARSFSDLTESELRAYVGRGWNHHDPSLWCRSRDVRLPAQPARGDAVCPGAAACLLRQVLHP